MPGKRNRNFSSHHGPLSRAPWFNHAALRARQQSGMVHPMQRFKADAMLSKPAVIAHGDETSDNDQP
jgi:hypothetical protein